MKSQLKCDISTDINKYGKITNKEYMAYISLLNL